MKHFKELLCGEEDRGQRLDLFLARHEEGFTRSFWQRLICAGQVGVNGDPRSPDYRLRDGDWVRVRLPERACGTRLRSGSAGSTRLWGPAWGAPLEIPVLYEDGALLAVNKPPGLLVHPLGQSWLRHPEVALWEKEPSLAAWLFQRGLGGLPRCGLVHRLDRGTSGILLAAKTVRCQRVLERAFAARQVEKFYRVLVWGKVPGRRRYPPQSSGYPPGIQRTPACWHQVEHPLGRRSGHKRVEVLASGRASLTQFRVLKSCGEVSHLEVRPMTGRTHQIRVHLKAAGWPVVGDALYSRQAQPGAARPMLHAWRLRFFHPVSKRRMVLTAELPQDFRDCWDLHLENRKIC